MSIVQQLHTELREHERAIVRIKRTIAAYSQTGRIVKRKKGYTVNRAFSIKHYAMKENIGVEAASKRLSRGASTGEFVRVGKGKYRRVS